jgi:hypothetical protein
VNKERFEDKRHIGGIDIGVVRAAVGIRQHVMNPVGAARCKCSRYARSESEIFVPRAAELRRTSRLQPK